MKTTLKYRITLLCMMLSFTVLLSGCSKDEDAINDAVSCDTFLGCNDATKWKQVFINDGIESAHIYLRINNDLNNPFENWLNISPNSCYFSMQISDHQFEIIENSNDKLIAKIVWQEESWQQDEFETWTFTLQGESLKLVTKYFQEVITFEFNNSSDDLNNLENCSD